MKWKLALATILAGILLLAGCAGRGTDTENTQPSTEPAGEMADEQTSAVTDSEEADKAAEYHKITPEEAKEMIDAEEDLVIVDVRRQEEYDTAHLPGAVLIPNETIDKEPPVELPDKEQKILVYCRTGIRSAQASEKLVDMGYTGVYDIGGINDWPYETTTD